MRQLLKKNRRFAVSVRRLVDVVCLLVWCGLFSGVVLAAPTPQPDHMVQLIDYLSQEKRHLTDEIQSIKQRPEPRDQQALALRKQQNDARLSLVQAKIAGLDSFLVNQRKQRQNLAIRLKELQELPPVKTQERIDQERISKINQQNEVYGKAIELLTTNLLLAHHYRDTLLIDNQTLNQLQAKFDEQRQLDALRRRIHTLDVARIHLYQKNKVLQQAKNSSDYFNTTFHHEANLLLNNQAIILIDYRINELELQKKLIRADYLLVKNQDAKTIQTIAQTYRNVLHQLVMMEQSLKKMLNLLQSEPLFLSDAALKQGFLAVQKTASLRVKELQTQQKSLQVALEKKEQQLKKQLAVRQNLSEYQLENWPSILNQLLLIPLKFYHYVAALAWKVQENYVWQEGWLEALDWISVGFILLAAMTLSRLLRHATQNKVRFRLLPQVYDSLLVLLYRNVPHLALLFSLIVLFFLNHIPMASYQLGLNLMFVWLSFRNLILIARLTLLEPLQDRTGHDARLYYRFKWLFLVGGWTTALMLFADQLPLPLLLQDLFNRLFMLFLLVASWVIWSSKEVIPYLFRPLLKTKKRYVRNIISLLTVLVPLILLTTAIVGLVGYIDMAWTMSFYQAYFLLVITSYLLIRGLVIDALDLLSEWMITSLRNGWLWIEVVLKPLDKLLRVSLFLVSVWVLCQVFGWYSDTVFRANVKQFIHYPLVDVSGVRITFLSILEFFLLLCVFIWTSKWTREFCYRWLFRHTSDVGVRNSLSVFTQYTVIIIGGFITLRVLGLDFSGMSMILGGLAVGMGFGLRDFASNIVGGVMLLIERPVREGDLITLGEYEGRVAHIGIRSMRVSSWDNMEVLIPNAETFNKPFTNWTHQDSVVRTVFPIKVSRSDDPVMIQQLVLDVLASIPEVLDTPPYQVLLTQIDEALIAFEVRYFINVQLYTRFEIRSKVLFAITAAFDAAGVKPPIPPLSVEIKHEPPSAEQPADE